jgi:hypothetical protein
MEAIDPLDYAALRDAAYQPLRAEPLRLHLDLQAVDIDCHDMDIAVLAALDRDPLVKKTIDRMAPVVPTTYDLLLSSSSSATIRFGGTETPHDCSRLVLRLLFEQGDPDVRAASISNREAVHDALRCMYLDVRDGLLNGKLIERSLPMPSNIVTWTGFDTAKVDYSLTAETRIRLRISIRHGHVFCRLFADVSDTDYWLAIHERALNAIVDCLRKMVRNACSPLQSSSTAPKTSMLARYLQQRLNSCGDLVACLGMAECSKAAEIFAGLHALASMPSQHLFPRPPLSDTAPEAHAAARHIVRTRAANVLTILAKKLEFPATGVDFLSNDDAYTVLSRLVGLDM